MKVRTDVPAKNDTENKSRFHCRDTIRVQEEITNITPLKIIEAGAIACIVIAHITSQPEKKQKDCETHDVENCPRLVRTSFGKESKHRKQADKNEIWNECWHKNNVLGMN